jgi:hypothetical protein
MDDFLDYYEKYEAARRGKDPAQTWLLAMRCRLELQKMSSDPAKEEEVFKNIFAAFVNEDNIKNMYRNLREDNQRFA